MMGKDRMSFIIFYKKLVMVFWKDEKDVRLFTCGECFETLWVSVEMRKMQTDTNLVFL